MPFWKILLAATKYRWILGVIEQCEAGQAALADGQEWPVSVRSIASVGGRKIDLVGTLRPQK
jgi:hypothetical protein